MAAEEEVRGRWLDRVLALAKVPELSDLYPDDLASVARWTREVVLRPGQQIEPEDGEPVVYFVLAGRLRGERSGVVEAPGVLGVAEGLAGEAQGVSAVDGSVRTLCATRSQLVWILEDVFEAWRAIMRHVAGRCIDAGLPEPGPRPAPLPEDIDPESLAGRILLLRETQLLGTLQAHSLGRLAGQMKAVEVEPGTIWSPGDPPHECLVLVEGQLAIRSGSTQRRIDPGTLTGLYRLLAGRNRDDELEAVQPSRLLRLGREALVDELEDDPDTAIELLTTMARQVGAAQPPDHA